MQPQMLTFLAEFTLPEFTEEFIALIPEQRMMVGRLMSAGTVLSISMALDRSKFWMTIITPTEHEASMLIASFPIASYVDVTLTELAFYEQPQLNLTHFSLN